MYYSRRERVLTCIAAILAGAALHFLYDRWPNAGTALFAPVNESLWEHVKLMFWPYLGAAVLLNRGRPGGIRPWLLMLPVLCGLMLALGWGYHVLLGGEAMAVDLVIYTAIMILGFWAPGCFSGPFQGIKWVIPILVVVVLAGLIGVFTLWPPDNILFVDLSGANTWAQIPC